MMAWIWAVAKAICLGIALGHIAHRIQHTIRISSRWRGRKCPKYTEAELATMALAGTLCPNCQHPKDWHTNKYVYVSDSDFVDCTRCDCEASKIAGMWSYKNERGSWTFGL